MKRGLLIQFLLLFAAVLIGYALVFGWIERRRVAKGPWEMTFSLEADRAQLILNQTNLNIRDVRLVFAATQRSSCLSTSWPSLSCTSSGNRSSSAPWILRCR
jgi:hypothetical protein